MSLRIGDLLIPNVRIFQSTGTGTGSYQSKTVTPTSSQQIITAASGYDALSSVTVNAVPAETGSFTNNGTYTPTAGHWFSSVTVNVPTGATINNQSKTVTPTELTQLISADSGYTGLSTVTVNGISANYVGSGVARKTSSDLSISGTTVTAPAGYYANNGTFIIPTETETITSNGTYTPTSGSLYSSVTVNVTTGSTIHNQDKSVNPTESSQIITYDSGYTGLGTVTVNAISNLYIGSGIIQRDSTDLAVSGATITAPTGYYASSASKSVATMTLPTAATSSATSGYTSKATIGRSTSDQYINIPTGYNATGSYYKISAVENGSVNNPTIIQGTITNNSITLTPKVVSSAGFINGNDNQRGTAVTITASQLVSGSQTVTTNDTYDVTNLATLIVNVPTGSTINNQDKTITPSTIQQTVSADSGYTGLGTVTIEAMPAANLVFDQITSNSPGIGSTNGKLTFYLNNATIQPVSSSSTSGYIDKNNALGTIRIFLYSNILYRSSTDVTSSNNTVTIPAGYYSSQVTKTITASTITNTAINGAATLEDTNDYAFDVTVTIPAGYYNATTLTKSFSSILPAPETEGTASQLLVGYDLYNHDGELISGSMTNNGAWNGTLDDTTTSVTIPAGYHNGSGTVSHTTVNIPDPIISVNSSTGVITASGSWTKGFTTDNSYSKTYSLSTQVATTATPTESEQTIVAAGKYTLGAIKVAAISSTYIGSGIAQRSSTDLIVSGATVTAPAGYYSAAASKSVANGSYGSFSTSFTKNSSIFYVNITYNNFQAGYFSTSPTFTPTLSIEDKSVTPGATSQVITPTSNSKYLNSVTVAGDANLIAENIKDGVTIFGVLGTHVGGSTTNNQNKTVTPSTSQQTITYDSGYTGLGTVTVEAVPTAVFNDATLNYSGRSGSFRIQWPLTTAGYVSTGLQTFINPENITGDFNVISSDMLITPTESQQAVASYGTFVNANITVDAIPNNYVGSAITSRDSSDLTVSGVTVTAPAGYYASAASKSVASGSATGPTSLSGTGASITTGTNTITFTKTGVTTTPTVVAGYVASATASTATVSLTANITPRTSSSVTASGATVTIPAGYYASQVTKTIGSGTATNSGSASGTSATLSTGTNTLTLTKSVSITPTVTAGYISTGTAGNVSVSLTASVTTKAAATITPSTSNQTIASGTYLTGTQTIAGDADLVPGNIKSGVDIFGVTGNYSGLDTSNATATAADIVEGETAYVDGRMITGNLVIQTYYTGTTAPASSLGQDGDIYLRS